jgi:chromate transporter
VKGASQADTEQGRLRELAALFVKLGTIAFGGPAAHIAMMEAEIVRRRRWLDHQRFIDLLGATNLIPGPNSTEMAIHIGLLRAGWQGLLVAGTCFIVPAMLIVWALAALYVKYGALPQAAWLLYGVKPVIIAIVAQALWGLGKAAIKSGSTALAAALVIVLSFFGANEILLLFAAGFAVMIVENLRRGWRPPQNALWAFAAGAPWLAAYEAAAPAQPVTLTALTLFFLKIGSVLFGSGYVLLAFLRADLVERWRWLTDRQLLDAIAIGQFTPGPVFTTATFVGYIVAGTPGALLATLGIFLPAFVFVALSSPLIPRLRRSPWAAGFLDGVNAASLGLMAAVTWQLGKAAIVDGLTIVLAVLAAALVFSSKINSAWLVLAGAIAGVTYQLFF